MKPYTPSIWPCYASLLFLAELRPISAATVPQFVFNPHSGGLGAVASEAVECSKIGRDLIAQGGNAVDALVGTTFCVGTVGMYHSGIGGGGFVVIRDADGNYESVDFRESAPAAAFQDMYKGNVEGSVRGGLAVGVPSEVRGLEYIHNKYGSLPWKTVVTPAAQLATAGFIVSKDLVRYMDSAIKDQKNFLVEDPVWAEEFAPNGTLLQLGDTIYRKRYGATLAKIAEEGPDVFYAGPIAESIVATARATNGTLTLDDLASYKVVTRPSLSTSYRGHRLVSIGAPASGAVCLNTLKIMEQFDPAESADAKLGVHRFDEALRFAYGARTLLGDPDFVDGIGPFEDTLLDEDTARDIRRRILDNQTHPVEWYNPHGTYASEGFGTSHIVTADRSGMATSLTTTVNLLFGAQIMDPLSGVILNNEMNDFSIPGVRNAFGFEPSPANFIRANKRPLSSITPVIVEHPDGTLYVTVGAAGGSRILSSTAQVTWHVLEHGRTMKEALREPRLHDQLMPNVVTFEYPFDNDTVASMLEKGHRVKWVPEGGSAVQGIIFDGGVFEAASEPRQKNSGAFTV
ncbi:gamma-glutamyltranspeptidase [Colletotrichum graminicola]|uniref:Glutathione hydrolase n=1 Tax=Colletotrichum graminicola (strain M1.001 / M2 / FGSC 10212) TaxID=645133 RepID=E3QGX8_COLGM|nr:gamma-glutamyltranspeptidase [Colletotrichum graminicola M1.001]EFQ30116.1 gamma-glutamyltranspeptidase [Colletotrichum graminicola M1.001]WDK09691.1 gamma-glutamyltranspeptidase [Colletotrichum graminicola]